MKSLLFIGGAIAVGSGLGYAAWRYNNRLVPEAVERAVQTDDWAEAQWLAGHQMMVGQIGKALIVPAVIVFGVTAVAILTEGGQVPTLPSGPTGFGFGSYL
jgi:hypothetical protein